MELWIRSQNKLCLKKVNELFITGGEDYYYIVDEKHKAALGKYVSEKRALEVLDEIQSKIKQQFIVKSTVLHSLKDLDKEEFRLTDKYKKDFIMQASDYEIMPINNNVIVYEMPEE